MDARFKPRAGAHLVGPANPNEPVLVVAGDAGRIPPPPPLFSFGGRDR